jgi:predicted ATP-dependent endonuclease of OLD family
MKVKSVEIKNFRSIRSQSLVFMSVADRACLILLGKNESGKSNILKAISLLDEANLASISYSVDCNKAAETHGESIEVRYNLDSSPVGR